VLAEAVTGIDAKALARMDRVVNLAGSALAAPEASFEGIEVYAGLAQKAAILGSRLIRNHPLSDGNKRTAWLAMMEFLERNGAVYIERETVEQVAQKIEALAAGELPEDEFIVWVRSCVDPYAHMSDEEFAPLESRIAAAEVDCLECGGTGKDLDGSTCIECGGEARTIEPDVGIFLHALVRRGLANLSSADLAATMNLASIFGFEWRESLGVPEDVPAAAVWEEALRATADSSGAAEKAIAHWRYGQ